ncbi:MAG: OmpH family outer membrane protein [Phycisphaerales bacterium]|nr:OmpH family outer membrane protein [Phycisphaerales bacterium]
MNHDRLWRWAIVGVLATIAAGIWVGLSSSASARNNMVNTPSPTSVAVVDIAAVLDRLDEKIDQEQNLKRVAEERRDFVKGMTDKIDSLKSELAILPADSEEARTKREEVVRLEAQRRIEAEIAAQVVESLQVTKQVELVRKIMDASKRVAQRDGWSIVLTDDRNAANAPEGQQFRIDQQLQLLAQQTVIAADNLTEITEEVIRLMNNEYKAGG